MLKGLLSVPVAVSLTLAGCAGRVRVAPLAEDHPASPRASETPFRFPSLQPEPQDAPRTGVAWALPPDASRPASETEGPSGHGAAHGQTHGRSEAHEKSSEEKAPAATAAQGDQEARPALYACPMHAEVVQDRPGRCPKCGMALAPKHEGK